MSYNVRIIRLNRDEGNMAIMPAPIRGEAVVRAAQESIKRYILDNQLGAGAPLPTEHALSRTLGISRNSLREALRALETVGVVETRHGLGTYVGQASLGPLIDGVAFNLSQRLSSDTRGLRELLELREILEVELIRRATGQHSDEQLDTLNGLVLQMEDFASQGIMEPTLDRVFHEVLYAPLRNRAVTLLLDAFWEVQEKVRLQLPPITRVEDIEALNAGWHRAIIDAVRRGDPAVAAVAMQEHFTGIERRMALLEE
jgi:DNA-binding FadR family transcriptional regulator